MSPAPAVSQSPDSLIWRDGQRISAIASDDRSLRYGDGLFETVRVLAGRPVLMAEHWARLSLGCARLGLPDDPRWRIEVSDFLKSRGDGIVRIQVSAGSGGRGYGRPAQLDCVLLLQWFDEPMAPRDWVDYGVRIGEARLRLASQPALAGIKHNNRLEQVLLRQELSAMAHCQEALVYDADDRVIEGVFSNLFFVRDGRLHTPALARCGIRGVLRDALLNACAEHQLDAVIDDFSRADVLASDAVFLVNSINGLWPVRACGDKTWRIDAITRQCQAIIAPWFANA